MEAKLSSLSVIAALVAVLSIYWTFRSPSPVNVDLLLAKASGDLKLLEHMFERCLRDSIMFRPAPLHH